MTFDDAFGCAVSTDAIAAIHPWNKTALAFLAHSATTPTHLAEVLAQDGDLAIAQACRGLFSLLLGRRELYPVATEALRLARASVAERGASPRERLYVDALAGWLEGRPTGAVACLDEVLAIWPQDALAMKLGQAIRFILGDQAGMRRAMESVLPRYDADHPALAYAHGCYAFTLEEAGDYAGAEVHGRRGLEIAPDDAWGLHAIAHVYDMTGRAEAGIDFLDRNRAAWAHCNNFRYHVAWHLALMHLDQGQPERVLSLYDAEVRADRTDDYRDIANASSLLMRLELEGVDVGHRWEELAELCAERVDDGCLAFADLHYMLALCGGEREAAAHQLIRRMHVDALGNRTEDAAVLRSPGIAVAKGVQAFRDGANGIAFANLSTGLAGLQAVGGSHAQRDVFDRLAIEAAIRAGQCGEARCLNDARTRRRGHADGFAIRRSGLIDEILGTTPATFAPNQGGAA